MWLRHWQLAQDPFSHAENPYVATPTHETVLAQLTNEVVGGASLIGLTGVVGVGKSTLACELARRLRTPHRRTLVAHDTVQFEHSLSQIAGGSRVSSAMGLAGKLRILRLENLSLLLVIDEFPPGPMLDRLLAITDDFSTSLCLVLVNPEPIPRYFTTAQLRPLTRSEGATYIHVRLARAGRDATTFCPQALNRLHAESGGCPGTLNQLARASLIHSATRSEILVSSRVVQEVARLAGPAGWYERLRVG